MLTDFWSEMGMRGHRLVSFLVNTVTERSTLVTMGNQTEEIRVGSPFCPCSSTARSNSEGSRAILRGSLGRVQRLLGLGNKGLEMTAAAIFG
jgi:hypothetical protein